MPAPEEIPKGRRIRGCDAVAVPVYQLDDELLSAVFAPPGRGQGAEAPSGPAPPLSAERLRELEPGRPAPGSGLDAAARSEGTGLTPEERDLVRREAGGGAGASCSSDEDWGDDAGDPEDSGPCPRGCLVQANASAYRALALGETRGAVGVGVSKAFHSAQECKGRHAALMLSGGKFAACIFGAGGRVEKHKVLKRYVVRGKQGGAQSGHDKKGGKAKSVGAQMRREGEKRLAEDVRALLSSWAGELRSCKLVLVSLPAQRRGLVFGDWLQPADPRVRKIPFPGLGQPGLEACLQAHSLVCSALFFRSWPPTAQADGIPSLPARRPRGGAEEGGAPPAAGPAATPGGAAAEGGAAA